MRFFPFYDRASRAFKDHSHLPKVLVVVANLRLDRCRKLYEKYLVWSHENCYAWTKYAKLEILLCETDRARAIFKLAIDQPALDMPEVLLKEKTSFEHSLGIRVAPRCRRRCKKTACFSGWRC